MKLIKAVRTISDILFNKEFKKDSRTFSETRLASEKEALEFENKRAENKARYVNGPAPELKRATVTESTDQDRVISGAADCLCNYISSLFGHKATKNKNKDKKASRTHAGFDIDAEEFMSKKAHKDKIDNGNITDEALISFAVKFEQPGLNKYKTAKFIVSYNYNSDEQFKVEGKFYDESDNEYELTSENLMTFLKTENFDVKAKKETPIAFFNGEYSQYETVPTTEPTNKVVARLISAGYNVEPNVWLGREQGPDFGRICYRVQVPHADIVAFKRLAAMTDDEWFNRASEAQRTSPMKESKTDWNDRALEKGASEGKDLKKDENWVNRGQEPGGHGNAGNPYNSEAKMLYSDASKKRAEEIKEKLVTKAEKISDVAKSIKDLEDLLK